MVTASEIVVFVHGVTSGLDAWSGDSTDDLGYIQSFYHARERTFVFMAEVRVSAGKPFCYYHYLMYGNVVGCDNRPGAYFGLTIRLDAYCKDWRTILSIMDVAFKTQVLGKLLVSDGERLRFSVRRLSGAESLLKEAERSIVDMFVGAFACKGIDFFESLDGFALSSGNSWKDNLGDCQPQDMGKALRDVGKVVLSPDYPSATAETLKKEYGEKLRRIKEDLNSQQADCRRKVVELECENRELRKSLCEMDKEILRLKKDNRPMATEENEAAATRPNGMLGNHAEKPTASFSWWRKSPGAELLGRKAKEH